MFEDKYKVKFISRKVILAWKNATESPNVGWEEIFPIVCALYELDDNFQKDESFHKLKVESMTFYARFKDILMELNLGNFNIHYFRKLTKHLLKTYLETNKEIRYIQKQKIATGQEITSDDIAIPDELVDELVCLYKELKKADINESDPQISRGVPTYNFHRRNQSGQYSKSSLSTEIGQGFEDERGSISSDVLVKPKKSLRRQLPTVPKVGGNVTSPLSTNVSPRLISNLSPKFIPGVSSVSPKVVSSISPKFTPGTISKTSPLISPSLSPSLSPLLPPVLSPPVCYNDNVTTYKKFVPPANANVITVKHPKKSNLRKIKRKSLKVATNPNTSFNEQDILSPTDSLIMSRISPKSASILEDDFMISPLSNRSYPMNDEVRTPKVRGPRAPSPSPSPSHKFTDYPTRTASLSPASQRRMSLPKRAFSQQNGYVEDYSTVSPNNNSVSPSMNYVRMAGGSHMMSDALTSISSDGLTNKYRNKIYSMDVLNLHNYNKANAYRKSMSTGLSLEENLPAIPPISNNYVEDILSTKMQRNIYEETSPSLQSPNNSKIYEFNSPPLTQYPSPTQSYNQVQYPNQSPYLSQHQSQSQGINTSFNSLNTSFNHGEDSYYDFLDRYAENEALSKTSPILVNNSPRFSLFSNNNLTQEGAIYAKSTSLKSVETLGFIDVTVPGNEGIPAFEEKEGSILEKYSILKSEVSTPLEEAAQISTVITDSTVIDSLESDLLSHKVQARKSIGSISSSLRCTPLKNDMVLTSIDEEKDEEKDEENNDKSNSTSDKGKEKEVEGKDEQKQENENEEKEEEEEKENLEIPDELKEKKQQFRLSFLTSKSSNSTLKRSIKADSENKLKESQTIEDEESTDNTTTPNNNNDENLEAKQEKENNTPSPKSSGSESPKSSKPYFVHPAQLYHMLQIFSGFAVDRFPRRSKTITQHWISTSNALILDFWEILKSKEDIISQIIIYATFYDQVKSRAFPLYDPDHVFLKELISSMDDIDENATIEEIQQQKTRRNRNRSISDPYLQHKFKGSSRNDIFKSIENQMSNQKLIMQIKKELLI